jgi:hypothetical protein
MIRTQEQTNYANPREHFVWALRCLPMIAGVGGITHPQFLTQWSEHLFNCGFFHRDYIASLADDNGLIHVDQLPRQVVQFEPAMRGPRHAYNNAARWVAEGTPPPEPIHLPDVNELTADEQAAMIEQFVNAGLIGPQDAGPQFLPAGEDDD